MNISELSPSALRKYAIETRRSISIIERAAKFQAICTQFFQLPEYIHAEFIIGYYGKISSGEFDTRSLINRMLEDGKRVYLPRCAEGDVRLDIVQIFDGENDVEGGAYGIMEPKKNLPQVELETFSVESLRRVIVLVPGSVFDRWGARFGYGAGYYDVFLNHLPVMKIAFAMECCVMKFPLPVHAKDIPMDLILTEKTRYP